ncbi:MAG: hypothetical protein MUF54_08840 [Polyangiaceae bacterium]|nr:hypothetical protein [Polyangiaceae bacterium]
MSDTRLQQYNWLEPVTLRGQTYFDFIRYYHKNSQLRWIASVLQPLEGPAAFAAVFGLNDADGAPNCTASSGYGPDGAAFFHSFPTTPPTEWLTVWRWEDMTHPTVASFGDKQFRGVSFNVLPGHSRLFTSVVYDSTPSIVVLDPATLTLHSPNDTQHFYALSAPKLVKDGVLMHGGFPYSGVYFMDSDGGNFRRVVAPAAGHYVYNMYVDHGAGDAIVWMEVADSGGNEPTDQSLWTAPYAAAPGDLHARKVAKFADSEVSAWLVANNGLVLFANQEDDGRLLRLSDGLSWAIPREPGRTFVAPVWVDDRYVWFLTSSRIDSMTDGLIRIERSTLGEPTIPSGL